jgi:hypothetical protein
MGERTISLTASAIQPGGDWSDRHNDLRSREPPMGLRRLSGYLGKHMIRRTPGRAAPRFGLLLLAVAVASAGCTGSSGGSSTPTATQPSFKVTSTIDGKTVLPHRIHWYAQTTLPGSQIKEVEFLVDGRVAWIEHYAPYTYAEGGGYLVTSWLAPGQHRFEVRAVAKDGRTAIDTVIARVLPAPKVPAALAGTWHRKITDTSGAPSPGSAGNPTDTLTPPGTYTITFERSWIHDVFPCTTSPCRFIAATGAGQLFDSDWTPGPKTFYVQGEVTFRVSNNSQRLAGWWCETWGPSATYKWSVSGDTLTLAPVGGADACSIRGFIWTGRWTRVR